MLKILLSFSLIAVPIFASPLLVEDEEKAKLLQQVNSLTAEKVALVAIIRLERAVSEFAEAPTTIFAAATSQPKKSTQEKLTDEHQKAKDGGYDKQFHEAIQEYGGTRLKEEWNKNCRSRVMNRKDARQSADLAETNCTVK